MCVGIQIYEQEESGAIEEEELATILRTALGVDTVDVSQIFLAIDTRDTEKITYGKGMCSCAYR